jgi:putative glutamine amidotransferase
VTTVAGTVTRRAGGARPHVASEHHQAIRRLGHGLRPSAHASDGVIEGVELTGARYAVGLQWHPEEPEAGVAGRRLGEAFVAAAAAEDRAA